MCYGAFSDLPEVRKPGEPTLNGFRTGPFEKARNNVREMCMNQAATNSRTTMLPSGNVPFSMVVTLRIKPEAKAEYLAALHKVLEPTRRDPDCVSLQVYEAAAEPDKIILFETWRDASRYQNVVIHQPLFQEYLAATEPMYAAPRVVELLKAIE